MVEELLDFARAKLVGMALAVEDDEAADPSAVGFFRPHAVVADAQRAPHDVEKLGTVSIYQSGRRLARRVPALGLLKTLGAKPETVCCAWPPPSSWRPTCPYSTARARLRGRAAVREGDR